MLAEVKRRVDNNDIKGLHYIFVDALDVDPTFEGYRKEYEYCSRINGFFEEHKEMTLMSSDVARWDRSYWDKLKMDLMKNFSKKRFEHMREVAKVVYSEKIKRLSTERARNNKTSKAEDITNINSTSKINTISKYSVESKSTQGNIKSKRESQKQLSNEKERQLGLQYENNKVDLQPKKANGVAIAVAVAVVVIAGIILIAW